MPLILEDEGKLLGKKQVIVPKKLVNKLKFNKNLFGKYKDTKGFKRISAIVDDDYNKRSDKKDRIHTDDKTISFGDLKRIDHDMRHMTPNPNNLEYVLPGGDDMKTWAHDTLRKLRTSVKKVKAVPPVPKLEKEPTKPRNIQKDVKMGNATVRLTENLDYFYENYFDMYGATYVFDSFLKNPNGKQNWGVLINPEMYAKALREFTRFGTLTNFPTKYVYQWMGIIMKNTATLIANTDICGHGQNFPTDDCEEFLKKYYDDGRYIEVQGFDSATIEVSIEDIKKMCDENGISINEATDKYGQTYFPWVTQGDAERIVRKQDLERNIAKFEKKYGDVGKLIKLYNEKNHSPYRKNRLKIDYTTNKIYWVVSTDELLYQIGITDEWMVMPDGSDAISDYGIDPILKILNEYDESLPPENVLVLVNKCLDVYHQRGDMASIFIQGGSNALSAISEETKRNKKVILGENQLLLLKEYHNQLVFNFDDEGNAYFKKNNWENYVDFIEEIGKPGILPKSEWTLDTIKQEIEKVKNDVEPDSQDLNDDDYVEAFLDVVCQSFIYDNDREEMFNEDFLSWFHDYDEYKENNNYYDECDTIRHFLYDKGITRMASGDDLEEFLTRSGYIQYQHVLKENFIDRLGEYGFPETLTINDRGLIYIERNIKIPKFNIPNFSSHGYKDYYNFLKNFYNDLGYCFSWEKDNGEVYCGGNFDVGTSEIRLKCWIDPKDVNWYETVARNCYSLREEREINVTNTGAKIEIFDIVLMHGYENGKNVSGKSLINSPIIITY